MRTFRSTITRINIKAVPQATAANTGQPYGAHKRTKDWDECFKAIILHLCLLSPPYRCWFTLINHSAAFIVLSLNCEPQTDTKKKMKDHRPSRTSVCARESIWVSWRWSASHPPGAFYGVPLIRRADFLISALRWRGGKNKTCKGGWDLTQAVNRVVPSPSEHLKRPKKSHYSLALSFSLTHTLTHTHTLQPLANVKEVDWS